MNPIDLIDKYYPESNPLKATLLAHSNLVAKKALEVADKHPELNLNRDFLYEAAMLHDIGIFMTDAPGIECRGSYPYICHGYLGADLVREAGFEDHARVCERHTGTGLSAAEIERQQLPLPQREMMPQTLEEQVICFADKFFSKSHPDKERSVEKVRQSLSRFGNDSIARFDDWCERFL